MSDELKAKLTHPVIDFGLACAENNAARKEDIYSLLAQIDAAYKEAGYYKVNIKMVDQEHGELEFKDEVMTRGQYLSRFRTELETMQPLMSPDGYEKFKKTALAVAERAAGVQE